MTPLRWRVDDTVASLNEGDTSSNLNILDNDTDLPDNGTLSVYSVGGTVFNLLTDSTNLTYTSGDGYKEVAGSYGTLYIKSDGTSYYIHDGDDDGGLTETFSYVATDGTNQDTGSPGTISLAINAVDDTAPVEVDDTVASLNEGDTSSNLNILDNDTDLPDNGTLSVYSVGGTVFNLLTDSTNLTYTSGDGYKEVAGSYGTLYIKSDGTSYYIHDGDDDGGLTETFSYVATDGTNQDTGSPEPSLSPSTPLMTPLRWKLMTPSPLSMKATPPAISISSTTTPIYPITAPSASIALAAIVFNLLTDSTNSPTPPVTDTKRSQAPTAPSTSSPMARPITSTTVTTTAD